MTYTIPDFGPSDLLDSDIEGERRAKTNPNMSLLGVDAWGRNKTVIDYSIYHGVFTYVIPPEMWIKYINGVEDLTNDDTAFFYSNNGKCTVKGGIGQSSYLMSKRHPRYQPNRGHLYSSSIMCPSPSATGTRRWGVFNSKYGAFFELLDGDLFSVVRTTNDGITTDDRKLISYDFDIDRGNIYDIQMQWRGVGNIKFYIGNASNGMPDLVATYNYLNTLTNLSISNPALPIGFEAIGDVMIECGCADVSSEGGKRETRFYQSLDSGEIALTTAEKAILAFTVSPTVDGNMNTRDCVMTRISAYSNDTALIKIYISRDQTSVTATWTDQDQGFQKFALNGQVSAFDLNKMRRLSTRWIPANGNVEIENPDQNVGDFYLIHGDIVLITITAKNNTLGGAFLEYSEEI